MAWKRPPAPRAENRGGSASVTPVRPEPKESGIERGIPERGYNHDQNGRKSIPVGHKNK